MPEGKLSVTDVVIGCNTHGLQKRVFVKELNGYMCNGCFMTATIPPAELEEHKRQVLEAVGNLKKCCSQISSAIAGMEHLVMKDLSVLSAEDLNRFITVLDDLPEHVKRLKNSFKYLKGIGNVVSITTK